MQALGTNLMTSSSPRVQRYGSVICYMHAGQHLLKVYANFDAFVSLCGFSLKVLYISGQDSSTGHYVFKQLDVVFFILFVLISRASLAQVRLMCIALSVSSVCFDWELHVFRKIAWLITAALLHVPRSGETKGTRSLRHSSSDNSRLRPPWSSSSELGWDTCAGYTGRGKNGTCDTGDSVTYYSKTLLDAHLLKKSCSCVSFSFYRPLSVWRGPKRLKG